MAQGTETPPAPPTGHAFVPLAFLKRPSGQVNITLPLIEDQPENSSAPEGLVRYRFSLSFSPSGNAVNPWVVNSQNSGATTATKSGFGFIPLELPDGENLLSLRIQTFTANLFIAMYRIRPGSLSALVDSQLVVSTPQNFDTTIPIVKANRLNIVDNRRSTYLLVVQNGSSNTPTTINQIAIDYQY